MILFAILSILIFEVHSTCVSPDWYNAIAQTRFKEFHPNAVLDSNLIDIAQKHSVDLNYHRSCSDTKTSWAFHPMDNERCCKDHWEDCTKKTLEYLEVVENVTLIVTNEEYSGWVNDHAIYLFLKYRIPDLANYTNAVFGVGVYGFGISLYLMDGAINVDPCDVAPQDPGQTIDYCYNPDLYLTIAGNILTDRFPRKIINEKLMKAAQMHAVDAGVRKGLYTLCKDKLSWMENPYERKICCADTQNCLEPTMNWLQYHDYQAIAHMYVADVPYDVAAVSDFFYEMTDDMLWHKHVGFGIFEEYITIYSAEVPGEKDACPTTTTTTTTTTSTTTDPNTTTTTGTTNCFNPDRKNSLAQALLMHNSGIMDVRLNSLALEHAADLNELPRDCDDIPSSWKSHPLDGQSCCGQNCLQKSLDSMNLTGTLKTINEISYSVFDEHAIYLFIRHRVSELGKNHTAFGVGVVGGAISYYTLETTDKLNRCRLEPLDYLDAQVQYCNNPDPIIQAGLDTIQTKYPNKVINTKLMKAAQMHAVDSLFRARSATCNTQHSWIEHPSTKKVCCDSEDPHVFPCEKKTMEWMGYRKPWHFYVWEGSKLNTIESVIHHFEHIFPPVGLPYLHVGFGVFAQFIIVYNVDLDGEADKCGCGLPDRINSIAQDLLTKIHPGHMDARLNDLALKHAIDLNIFNRRCHDFYESWISHPLDGMSCCSDVGQNCLEQSLEYMNLTGSLRSDSEVYLSLIDKHMVKLFLKSRTPEEVNKNTAYGIGIEKGVIAYYTLQTTDELLDCPAPTVENPDEKFDYCNNPDTLVSAAYEVVKDRFPNKILVPALMKGAQIYAQDSVYREKRWECNKFNLWYSHPSNGSECCEDPLVCDAMTLEWMGLSNSYLHTLRTWDAPYLQTPWTVKKYFERLRPESITLSHLGFGVFSKYITIFNVQIPRKEEELCGTTTTTTTRLPGVHDCHTPDDMNAVAHKLFKNHTGVMDARLNDLALRHATDLNRERRCRYEDVSMSKSWSSHPFDGEKCCEFEDNCLQKSLDFTGMRGILRTLNEVSNSWFDEQAIHLFIEHRLTLYDNKHSAFGIAVDRGVLCYYRVETDEELMPCHIPPFELPGDTLYCNNPDPLIKTGVNIIEDRFPKKILDGHLMKGAQMHAVDSVFKERIFYCQQPGSWLEHPSTKKRCCIDRMPCENITREWLGYNWVNEIPKYTFKIHRRLGFHTNQTVTDFFRELPSTDVPYSHIGIGVYDNYIGVYNLQDMWDVNACNLTIPITTELLSGFMHP